MFEAQAIAIEIEKIIPNRPMTHDLFKSFAASYKYQVEEILISDLKEGVFFAKIVCSNGKGTIEIDARPSDAIAIGIRFDAPIFTYETILAEAGIVLTEEAEGVASLKTEIVKPKKHETIASLKDLSIDKLNEILKEAIDDEDYERAAKIRDEINKRN
jgi:hypothetical protein